MIIAALRRVRLDWYDTAGAALVAAFACWAVVSAVVRDGNPIPQLVVVATAVAAYVTGRRYGKDRRGVERAAASIVLAIFIGVALSGPDVVAGGPLAPPLGYANANGSLYVLGVGAAVMVALCAKPPTVRATAGLFAAVLGLFAVATLSKAAAILAACVLPVTLIAHRLPRWTVLAAPLIVATTVAVTIAHGLSIGSSIAPRLVEELSQRRQDLWREAMEITASEPVFGVGPGMFAHTSPTAMSDSDARWAHSAYLQVGAELGVVGLLLLSLLLLWVYGALYRSRHSGRLVPVGAAVVTAVAVHAAIDYVIHFPAVVFITALLAGLISSPPGAAGPAPNRPHR